MIEPSNDWTFESSDHIAVSKMRHYYPNDGYKIIQGSGRTSGRLIGGHTGIIELEGTPIELKAEDYDGAITLSDTSTTVPLASSFFTLA